MPLVTMPDGTQVQMPDKPDPALLARLQAFQQKTTTPPPSAFDNFLGTAKNVYGSFLEPAATMASGAAGKVAGDIGGLGAIPANAMGLTDQDPAAVKTAIQNAMTYQPRTSAGQDATRMLGQLAQSTIGNVAHDTGALYSKGAGLLGASQGVQDAIQNGVQEGVEQAPGLMGARAKLPAADLAPAAKVNPLTAETLKNTREAGFLVTPTYAGDTSVTGNLATLSGSETKLQQAISRHNTGVQAPKVAARDIGIDDGNLTPAAIDAKAKAASGVYSAVKKVGALTPDAKLVSDMKSIGVRDAAVDQQFGSDISPDIQKLQTRYGPKQNPNYKGPQTDAIEATANPPAPGQPASDSMVPPNPKIAPTQMDMLGAARQEIPDQFQPMNSEAIVDAVRGLRADSKKLYTKGLQDPEAARMADAAQNTADALDDFLQRSLVKNGQPNLAKAFTDARTQLAKIHSVRDAFNEQTGSIDVASLAHDLDRGVPLSGGLKTMAEAYKAFPKAFQTPERLPHGGPTILEQGGLVAALLHGEPMLAAASLARPVARALVQRPAYQNRIAGLPLPPQNVSPLSALAQTQPLNPLAVLGQQVQQQ